MSPGGAQPQGPACLWGLDGGKCSVSTADRYYFRVGCEGENRVCEVLWSWMCISSGAGEEDTLGRGQSEGGCETSDLSRAGDIQAEVIPEECLQESALRSQGPRQAGCSRVRGVQMSGKQAMLQATPWVLGQEAWDRLWTTSAPEGGPWGMCWQSYGEKPGQSCAIAAGGRGPRQAPI